MDSLKWSFLLRYYMSERWRWHLKTFCLLCLSLCLLSCVCVTFETALSLSRTHTPREWQGSTIHDYPHRIAPAQLRPSGWWARPTGTHKLLLLRLPFLSLSAFVHPSIQQCISLIRASARSVALFLHCFWACDGLSLMEPLWGHRVLYDFPRFQQRLLLSVVVFVRYLRPKNTFKASPQKRMYSMAK